VEISGKQALIRVPSALIRGKKKFWLRLCFSAISAYSAVDFSFDLLRVFVPPWWVLVFGCGSATLRGCKFRNREWFSLFWKFGNRVIMAKLQGELKNG
jgi:hypothetical protein